MSAADHAEIGALMEFYFEGLHRTDAAMLRDVFHPRLAYVCATAGDELYLDLESYMARIEAREAPAARGEPRDGRVLEIAIGSDRLARVTARMRMLGRDYLDFLTLVREGPRWRIVAKIFAHAPDARAPGEG